MNWAAVSAVSDFVASIAVLVTLIFLVIQLKHNSAMIKNSTAQHASNAGGDWLRQLIENPDLYAMYRTGLSDYESLDKNAKGRFHMLCLQAFRDADTQYQHYLSGGTEYEQWASIESSLETLCRTPGGRKSWEYQKALLTRAFREEFDRFLTDA